MDPRIIVTLEEVSGDLKEEIAETEDVEPLWSADIFSMIVIEPESVPEEVACKVEAIDGVEHAVIERTGEQNEMRKIEDTDKVHIEPEFDKFAETERLLEELSEVSETIEDSHISGVSETKFDRQRMAVIDSGIDIRNAQITNVVSRINLTEDDTLDSIGHGTAMACILNMQRPYMELFDMKVFDGYEVRESNIIKALALSTDPSRDIFGVSLSLGLEPREGYCPLCDATNKTAHAGVVVSVSSGELAKPIPRDVPPMCPARAEKAIAVTADSDKYTNDWFADGDVVGKADWTAYE
ncbi:S8 family serine peptidase [Natrinema versiforme]|uniref:Peptidase S8/S53 domain-containing protein n=1 Tax=Natrinema versiforme TaxID=88724 RepID=A0A4V1FYF3_9EURY|nr:S8 family serine peptidase [Natrinema versiforme]QCS41304.1 hypothetical protein FEJ81_02670 [Natrinema versiforme]